jgi:hypothetical protein
VIARKSRLVIARKKGNRSVPLRRSVGIESGGVTIYIYDGKVAIAIDCVFNCGVDDGDVGSAIRNEFGEPASILFPKTIVPTEVTFVLED